MPSFPTSCRREPVSRSLLLDHTSLELATAAMLRAATPRTLRAPLARAHPPTHLAQLRPLSSSSLDSRRVKVVEVGPRDGLQNEKAVISTEVKVELIERLIQGGLRCVESGSFVSPKWVSRRTLPYPLGGRSERGHGMVSDGGVADPALLCLQVPQMASTAEVVQSARLSALRSSHKDLSLPVLVPNTKGLDSLLALPPNLTDEIAVFVSASEGFSRANLNCSIAESLARLEPVFRTAHDRGLKVRGYVSVVLGCPFDGRVEPQQVAKVAKALRDLGAYEVSLGDTIGVGVPRGWDDVVVACEQQGVPARELAVRPPPLFPTFSLSKRSIPDVSSSCPQAHCHDTYGTALASILHCVSQLGIRTVDSSIAALGGCPYSPGATGNVATEDVLYALSASGVPTTVLPDPDVAAGEKWEVLGGAGWGDDARSRAFDELCRVGEWISAELRRENGSRVGKAMKGRRERDEAKKAQQKAKL